MTSEMAQVALEMQRDMDRRAGLAMRAAGIVLDDESVTLERVTEILVAAGVPAARAPYYHRELTARVRGVRSGRWTLQGRQEPDED